MGVSPYEKPVAKIEHIVYETGCRQVFRAVMADHQCVGKSQDNHTQLADYDGDAELEKGFIVLQVNHFSLYSIAQNSSL